MKRLLERLKICLPFFILFTLLILAVGEHAFFWDTLVQASQFAQYYFENKFSQLFLPPELDAGHPPFFAIYLALTWKIFGKTLIVSHLAVLPFVLGIIWQVFRFVERFYDSKYYFWILLFVLSDATLLAQSTLVSPDLVLLFGFLLALNGVVWNRRRLLVIGTIFMVLVSIRGLFATAAIFLIQQCFHIIRNRSFKPSEHLEYIWSYIPVILAAGFYYFLHYSETGWLLSTPNEKWSGHRGLVDLKGFLRNIGILGWRLLDFGRVAVWIGLLIAFIPYLRRKIAFQRDALGLCLFPIMVILTYAPALLLIDNPIGHRYLLPCYLLVALATAYLLMKGIEQNLLPKYIFPILIILQLMGNMIVYPRHIAQGWDSTLAHLPYYGLRKQMINYITSKKIPLETVGTEFPNIGALKYIDLEVEGVGFAAKDLNTQDYIFYSNVFNDFSDEELADLEKNWTIEKAFRKFQIEVILYKKK